MSKASFCAAKTEGFAKTSKVSFCAAKIRFSDGFDIKLTEQVRAFAHTLQVPD
ncbi:hypothetical protein L4G92_01015 [Neisseria sp. ZJ106]|uniref:Uncharacterized protein n=1 Tax=Neisseria lisongii TaxID=2912188 RepID=A0ABY7RIT2_9NEIS|nr:hypothetical protein [Neisseria lisongii]MCF7520635.1 hypothetical protein [Neisseria lisongii]WCL71431.1 hypothetical protein PJU73_08910 [Neisseria lisongii]